MWKYVSKETTQQFPKQSIKNRVVIFAMGSKQIYCKYL